MATTQAIMNMGSGSGTDTDVESIPFAGPSADSSEPRAARSVPARTEGALAAVSTMSRRIDDLARELNCLGFFDDDDRPRAA